MNVVNKILLMVAGLIMTVALIYVGFGMMRDANSAYDILEEQNRQRLQQIEEFELTRYEDIDIDGSVAVNYIKTNWEKTSVKVITDKKTFVAESSQFASYKQSASEYYINPLKMYHVSITRNSNGIITDVLIKIKP